MRVFLHILKHFKKLIKHRVSNFAFLRMEGVVRSVDEESLLSLFCIGNDKRFILALPKYYMVQTMRKRVF